MRIFINNEPIPDNKYNRINNGTKNDLTLQQKTDVLGIDNIVIEPWLWKMNAQYLVSGIIGCLLITAGIQYYFKIPDIQIVQTFSTVLFFGSAIVILLGVAAEYGEYSPTIRYLRKTHNEPRDKYNLKNCKGFYIACLIIFLCSFLIIKLENHNILP